MENRTHGKPIEILLVEDNPADVRLTQEGLREAKLDISLTVAIDGSQALAFLRKEGVYAGTPFPDLILLDLNLPGVDGREVLRQIKSDSRLKHLPVVILSSSEAEQDIAMAYDSHANCYVTKPIDFDQFVKVVKSIQDFWFSIVRLPTEARVAMV